MHYEKIEGLTNLPSSYSNNNNNYSYDNNNRPVTSAVNYHYNINSVWED